eukprot:scaffold1433_cov128-Skeletonema_dohrnii-CCMP3373.AAC.9
MMQLPHPSSTGTTVDSEDDVSLNFRVKESFIEQDRGEQSHSTLVCCGSVAATSGVIDGCFPRTC